MKLLKKILAAAGVVMLLATSSAFAAENPCAGHNPCAMKSNPCAAKSNPCAAKKHKHHKKEANPCASHNPCAAKGNPCAMKNPCADKKM